LTLALFFLNSEYEPTPLLAKLIALALVGSVVALILYKKFNFLETIFASYTKSPFFNHVYFRLYKLPKAQRQILKSDFRFYQKLLHKHKRFFEHRVAIFIKRHQFMGNDLEVTDQMKVMIAATATMLTFGYRQYSIRLLDKIILYQESYYSTLNEQYHKGEFNPAYGALVFSWKDFLDGYAIPNDNLNVGIHEFIHAIHINAIQENNITSTIFLKAYSELGTFLTEQPEYRERLIASGYIRDYAFENKYEFIAVLVECFIETPKKFMSQFPEIYSTIESMLNFKNYRMSK
jgi:Mlc titration factor MtfA (ptsG expression regulator)